MSALIPIKSIQKYYNQENPYGLNDFQSIDLTKDIKIKKILILKWGGMGDVILASAIIEDIFISFPNSKIDINTLPQWKNLFKNDSRINKIWGFNNNKGLASFNHMYRWLKEAIAGDYNLIIDLQTNDRTRIYLSFLKLINKSPKYVLGNHAVKPYSIRPKTAIKTIHPFQMMQRTINSVGIKSDRIFPKIYTSKNDKDLAKKILKDNNLKEHSFIVLICGSNKSGMLKRWGAKNFIELSFLIESNLGYKSLLVGGPDDTSECNAIFTANSNTINICNQTDLPILSELFKNAKFVIANDTGIAHLASSTKTPMIVITGPTDPRKVKPMGEQVLAIQAEIECKNCYQKSCSHHSCMKGLKANDILNTIKKLL